MNAFDSRHHAIGSPTCADTTVLIKKYKYNLVCKYIDEKLSDIINCPNVYTDNAKYK